MFERLKSIVGDDAEALKIIGEIEATQSELTKQVNGLEVKFEEAKNFRDSIKNENRLVREKLGVEEVTEEAINSFFKSNNNSVELDNLKLQLEKTVKEREEVEIAYKKRLGDYVLKTELTKTNLATDALNPKMYEILEKIALDGAFYEDGNILYKNGDGSTRYGTNGKPMSLADKVEELRTSDDYANLFKPKQNSGTGTKNNGGQSGGKSPQDYTEQERIQLFKENPDRFKQLFG